MKRFRKAIAMISTLLLLGSGFFVSCAGDDDEDSGSGSTPTPKPSPTQGPTSGPTPDPTPSGDEYTVEFQASGESTYKDGVYTLVVQTATEASANWANQIFIKNPNSKAGIAAGDKIHAKITANADKAINTFFFKDQFNGQSYSGIDVGSKLQGLEAGVAKTFDLYGVVAGDYNENSACFVIDLRGNEANTTIKVSDILVEKLTDYDVTSLTIVPSSESVSSGEKVTLTTNDQFGFAVEGVTYEITSVGSTSTLSGNELTAGTSAETVTVKATFGSLSTTVDITVTVEKDYGKYFKAGSQYGASAEVANDYMALWYVADAGWGCGPVVEVADVTASAKEYSLTRNTTGDKDWSTQISYRTAPGKYLVSFKAKSTAAGKIAVLPLANADLKSLVELEANTEKEVSFIAEVENDNGILMQINLGASESEILPAGTFTLSDFTVVDANSITVESVQVIPSETSVESEGKVSLSAKINGKYFVSGAEFTVTDGEGVTGSSIENGKLSLGKGAGKVSVKATYNGVTSEPVEITVTAKAAYAAPDLTAFYKKYFITTKTDVTKVEASLDTWSSGSTLTPNESDGTLKVDAASMWGGISGAVVALNLPSKGFLAKYDYLVLTLDMSDFVLITEGVNSGVNIKIPEVQKSILNNYVENPDGTRTYYAKLSDFEAAPSSANQLALIAGGTGSLVVKEVFIAAEKDPDTEPEPEPEPAPGPTPSGDTLPVIPAGNENRKTQIEGAGVWIYLDNADLGITGANAADIKAESSVTIKDHASGNDVTVSSWEFNDYGNNPNTVRLYVVMPDADHTTIDVAISLKIGTKTYAGTVSFASGVYQFDYKPTAIELSASAVEVKPGDEVTFTVKGTPYGIDVTDKCTFTIVGTDATGSAISGKTLKAGSTNGTVTVKATCGDLEKTIDVKVNANALPTIMSTSKIEGAGIMIWISKDVVATTPAKEDVNVTGKLSSSDAAWQNYVSDNLALNLVEVLDQGNQTYIYFTQPAGFTNGADITETFVITWGNVTVNAEFYGNALKSSSVIVAN